MTSRLLPVDRLAGTYGLHVISGGRAGQPRATYLCPCGHVQRARGVAAVQELAADGGDAHRAQCPLRVGYPDGGEAA